MAGDSPRLVTPAAGSVSQLTEGQRQGQATEQLSAPLQERPQQPTKNRSWLDHDTQQL